MLEDVHTRLSGVVIECLPYQVFMPRYDRPEALFYLDPPYFNHEKDYGPEMFSKADFDRLAELMKAASGKVLMSINDHPAVREIFDGLLMHEVQTTYSAGRKADSRSKKRGELLISNWDWTV